MKRLLFNYLVFLVVACVGNEVSAQVYFGNVQIIEISNTKVLSMAATDIDGDGDQDVITAGIISNSGTDIMKINWYENINAGRSFLSHLIYSPENEWQEVLIQVADIDNDLDHDLIVASDDGLYWFENVEGNGTFECHKIINKELGQTFSCVCSADIDNDGDQDIISAAGDVVWYENMDGRGSFSTNRVIAKVPSPNSVCATDIDRDGDKDVLWTNNVLTGMNSVSWGENTDGLGSFKNHVIHEDFCGNYSFVLATDMDNDSDMDIISTDSESELVWYENIDGSGRFEQSRIILSSGNDLSPIVAADFDNDDDPDLVFGYDDTFFLYENMNAFGLFDIHVFDENIGIVKNVCTADINGDGWLDIIKATNWVVWYENLMITEINTLDKNNFLIYPNPTTQTLNIHIPKHKLLSTNIKINSLTGQQVLIQKINASNHSIDVSNLANGYYIISVCDVTGNVLDTEPVVIY